MKRPALLPSPARTYEAVRSAIDARLGDGRMSAGEAVQELKPVEHAVWVLDNLLASLFEYELHLFDQRFCRRKKEYDGAQVVAAIAEVAREIDPQVADLLAWTSRCLSRRSVPLVSLVPMVWDSRRREAVAFLETVAARWPATLDPFKLPRAPTFSRPVLRASRGTPRFPTVEVGFSPRGKRCPVYCDPRTQQWGRVRQSCFWALWTAGVADAELDRFFWAFERSGADGSTVDLIRATVSFDGDGGDDARAKALHAELFPGAAVMRWLGLEGAALPNMLVRMDAASLAKGAKQFAAAPAKAPFVQGARLESRVAAALRKQPTVLFVDSGTSLDGPTAQHLLDAVLQRTAVVLAGSGRQVDELIKYVAAGGAQVFDRRARRGARKAA